MIGPSRIPSIRPFRGSEWLGSVLVHAILLLLAAAVILPLVLPFFFAFKTQLEFAYHPWSLPTHLRWENFKEAWDAVQLGTGMKNTILVCLGAILVTVVPSAMAGYIFARYRSRTTEVVFYLIMAGFFVPVQMVLIPLYRLSIQVGLVNTLPGLFLPMAAFGIPFWTMIYRSFYLTLPGELAEAARIDGAGHFGTFRHVMLPLAKPATVLATLLTFMGAWNDYMLSLILISKPELYTLQLSVAQFLGTFGTNVMPRYAAGILIAAAPTVLLYLVGHRWIIQGTIAGALKG